MLYQKKYVSVKFCEKKLKKRHRALAVVYDIGGDLTSSLGLAEILDRAILKICKHFGYAVVRIYLLDDDKQHLTLVAQKGLNEQQTKSLSRIPIDTGFSGKAVRTKSFIAQKVSELQNKDRTAMLRHVGLKVIICVPLIIKGDVIGVMNLGAKRMISLNEDKIDLLIAIGNQIAIAVNAARLHEEVRRKAEEINKKKEDLEFFAYTISHDLKNPAVGVSGFARLLFEKYEYQLDERGRQYCQYIMRSAQQIESFTKSINAYIVAKKVAYQFQKIDVGKIINHIQDELSGVLQDRNIDFIKPQTIPEITADESALTRVLKNLIDNALKHGGDAVTKLILGYDEDDQHHIFSVNNDGLVMKKSGSDVIFEMFRKHPDSKQSEGSGLGLAIVKEIADAHHGKAWFDSHANRGTTFYVSISKNLGERQGG